MGSMPLNLGYVPLNLGSMPYAYPALAREGKRKGRTGEVCERGHPDNKAHVIRI
jgi:hypothetical protein